MSLVLIGFSALSGIPLFSRHEGPNAESMSFEKMALLNTINHYSRLNYSNLMSTHTGDSQIHWKIFRGSIFLILVVHNGRNGNLEVINESTVGIVLNTIFNTMVLCCGITNLLTTLEKNIELFKNTVRSAFPLIDHILYCLCSGTSLDLLLERSEYLLTDHATGAYLESIIENYLRIASSQYGCLLINGKLVSASKGWWQRISSTVDGPIILNAIASLKMSENQTKELKIYLPSNAPDSVTRLCVFNLYKNVNLAILCSDNPPIKRLEDAIQPLRESRDDLKFFRQIQTDTLLQFQLDEHLINAIIMKNERRIFTKFGAIDDVKLRNIIKLTSIEDKLHMSKRQQSFDYGMRSCESFLNFGNHRGLISDGYGFRVILLFPYDTSYADMKKIANKTLTMINRDTKLWP